ncbi:BTAD domain-containing putative transcriptional regulator [Amycolatopsis thermoflava]|uniref:BTAD domain-containing putative transcriptional regulator n=1 Tax=Amycolatopsis thermoflava TaxID=84480 RepID=UPI00365C3C30
MTPRTSAAATSGDTSSPAALRFGILGPLDVAAGGESLALGGPKQRELLAVLLLHLNQFVPPGRLAEALWGAAPPAGAEVTLRTHVSHLRRRLAEAGASGALATRRSGYGLLADPAQLDSARFEQLVGLGREALGLGDAPRAATLLRQALDLWRGPVLEDLHAPLFAEAETARLDELRLVATESRIEADLALGRHAEAVPELERLVDVHPFRERLTGQLMLALYRTGRQVDALDVAARARRRLADELGLDPGPALAGLETRILRHDPALLPAPRLVAPTGAPAPRVQPPPDALFTVVRRVPMAGRSAELAHLRSLWHDVRDGGRRVALVSGEGGVGKTRLVAEFAHEAAADAHVLVGRCDPAAMLPYHPIASAFRASAEVDACLDLAPPALRARLTPLLSRPADTTPGPDDRRALFEAATWVLTRLADTAPVALVVEEAERLDRASSLLLRHLVEHLPARVLLVLCFRDPPGGHHLPLLDLIAATEGLADRLTLGPLTETELAALVTAVAGDVPAGFVPRLWRATGGNPFYAAEVARDRRTREDWQGGQVPAGVRDVVRHRLRTLPERAQHVVRCAAVLGPEAGYELLARLADQPEEQLIDALEAAVAAGFLVEAGRSWQVAYAFPHDLLRDAVHADLPVPRRQRLHLRAAQLLRDRPAETASAAVHLRAAGPAADPLEAAELSLAAAGDAQRMYAWDEAIAHAEAAVAILDQAGAPAPTRADAAVRTAILRLRASTGFPEAVRLLEHALELYRGNDEAVATVHARLGGALCTHHSIMDIPRALDHFAAARRVLPDGRAGFHLHRGRAQAAMYGLRTATLGAAADQARELAARLGRRDLTVLASWAAAWFRFNRGELAAAAAIEEDMWARVQDLGDPYVGWGPVNMAALTATEYLLDPVAGRRWCRRGLSQARFDTLGYPHDAVADQLVLALALAGDLDAARRAAGPLPADAVSRRLLLLLDGDWEAAEHAWSQARAADEAAGDRHDAAFHARWLATTRTLLGDTGGAVTALRQALDLAVAGPQVPTELIARAELARLLAATDPGEAARHLARCDEILAGGEDWRGRAGTVALARAAVTGDDTAYETALRLFAGLPWHRADALRAWAAALDTTGRGAEAGEKLAAARRIHDEIGAHPRWRH